MSAEREKALATLQRMARSHPGASSGERAASEILAMLQQGRPVDLAECLVCLDGGGRHAVILLLIDLATGKIGLADLR